MRLAAIALLAGVAALTAVPAHAAPGAEFAPCGTPPRPNYVVRQEIVGGQCVFIYAS